MKGVSEYSALMTDSVSCPNQCGAQFQNASRVISHLNHPWSPCHNYFIHRQEQISAESALPSNNGPRYEQDPDIDMPDAENQDLDGYISEDDGANLAGSAPPTADFPEAGRTFGSGPDFMSQFDADIHAEKCRTFPVYPWATKEEWQLMSWLSRSGLSMAKIDEFFRLKMVCYTFLQCAQANETN